METYYYKVVNKDLCSCFIFLHAWCVHYKVGEWVKPMKDKTKLMCFEELEDARSFILGMNPLYGPLFVYECEVKNPAYGVFVCDSIGDGYLSRFWDYLGQAPENRVPDINLDRWFAVVKAPRGTVMVDEIKLVKNVDVTVKEMLLKKLFV